MSIHPSQGHVPRTTSQSPIHPHPTNSTCASTLTREYFALLGLCSRDDAGLALLRSTGLLPLLPRLGARPATTHLARLALVHLDYTNPSSSLGKDLLLSWLLPPTSSSPALRLFALNVLKALLYDPRVPRVEQWGVDALLTVAHTATTTAAPAAGESAEVRKRLCSV